MSTSSQTTEATEGSAAANTATLISDLESFGDFYTARELIRARLNPRNFGRGHKAANRAAEIMTRICHSHPDIPYFRKVCQAAENATKAICL